MDEETNDHSPPYLSISESLPVSLLNQQEDKEQQEEGQEQTNSEAQTAEESNTITHEVTKGKQDEEKGSPLNMRRGIKRTNAVRKKSQEKPTLIKITKSSSSPDILEEYSNNNDNNNKYYTKVRFADDTVSSQDHTPLTPPPLPPRPSLSREASHEHSAEGSIDHTHPPPLPPRAMMTISRESSTGSVPGLSPLVTSSTTHTRNELKDKLLGLIKLDKNTYDLSSSEEENGERKENGKLNVCSSLPALSHVSSTNNNLKRFTSFPSCEYTQGGGYVAGDEKVGGVDTEEEEDERPHPFNSSFSSHERLHNQDMLNELFFKFNYVGRHGNASNRPRQRSATETSVERMGRASDMIRPRSRDFSEEPPSFSETEEELTTPILTRPTDEPLPLAIAPSNLEVPSNLEEPIPVLKTKKKPKKLSTNYSPQIIKKRSPEISEIRKSRTQSVIEGDLPQYWRTGLGDFNDLKSIPEKTKFTQSPRPRPKIKKFKLHNPKTPEKLWKYLISGDYDQVERDERGDTPLHAIIRSDKQNKIDYLLIFMVHSDYGTENIDLPDRHGNTALHIAVQKADYLSTQILLVFGANIDALNSHKKTALDTLCNKGVDQKYLQLIELFQSLYARHGKEVIPVERTKHHTTRLMSISLDLPDLQEKMVPNKRITYNNIGAVFEKPKALSTDILSPAVMAQKLETNLNELYTDYDYISDADIQFAMGLQQFELQGWKKTSSAAMKFNVHGGSRVLFLDGGGIRGLIQIEVMSLIEQRTGRTITELFDWIVGTSTGGIVALGLVYGKKTLAELRQFYFKLKEDVFTTQGIGGLGGFNTDELVRILKEVLGTKMKMSDVKEPKILISAVNKRTTNLQLNFFNNCFDDQFSDELVWKVARYTSAAPGYFAECDDYVDGGVLANNPNDYGLTAIQNFHRHQGCKLDIAAVVSIGTGIFPAEVLGSIDAHTNLLNVHSLTKRAGNLITLLTKALVESEDVAMNCRSRCEEQRVPFFRFCPQLDSEIPPGETDSHRLIDMIMTTKHQAINDWADSLDELMYIFTRIEEYSRKEKLQVLRQTRQRGKSITNEGNHYNNIKSHSLSTTIKEEDDDL